MRTAFTGRAVRSTKLYTIPVGIIILVIVSGPA
jgi:hypothetical protein